MSKPQFDLDWQLSKEKLNERGKHLLETGLWSDCTFIVGVEPCVKVFETHKLMLSLASPVFEAMFHGLMAEKDGPIPILDVQPDAFRAMLMYIYSDTIELQSFDQACELCYVAKKYMIYHLVKECTNYIWSDVNHQNACRALEFARLFNEQQLLDKCLQIICTNTSEILNESSFLEIAEATLLTILDQNELNILSELELFEAVQKWAEAECQRRGLPMDKDCSEMAKVAANAVVKVRFLTMEAAEFAKEPAVSGLLSEAEAFAILMNICAPGSVSMPVLFSTCIFKRHTHLNEVAGRHKLFFCERTIVQQVACYNGDRLNSCVTFTVNRDIVILGVQVPTQVPIESNEMSKLSEPLLSQAFVGMFEQLRVAKPSSANRPGTYKESIYADLSDGESVRLSYNHCERLSLYKDKTDLMFNLPIKINKDKIYKIGVVLHKMGWYPMGSYSKHTNTCGSVLFTFCVGNAADSFRDCLIQSIIFTF